MNRRTHLRSVAVILGVSALLVGCASPTPPAEDPLEVWAGDNPAHVSVEPQTIQTVVVAQVTVVALPEYVITAPKAGKVQFSKRVQEGKSLGKNALVAKVGGKNVRAPLASRSLQLLVQPGERVRAGVPIAVLRYNGFAASGNVPVEQGYRLRTGGIRANVQFKAGPANAECIPVTPRHRPDGSTLDTNSGQQYLNTLCLFPADAGLVEGLPGTLGILTAQAENVLGLPLTAVSGSTGRATVVKVEADGSLVETEVELGISDGNRVEVKSGLEAGDTVLRYGPSLTVRYQG